MVHIDSSIFIGKNFYFSGTDFKTLVKWAKEGKIRIILTSLTVEEVRSNISKSIDESIGAIRKARNGARILRNLSDVPIGAIFNELDRNELEEKILCQFQRFIIDSKAEVLSLSGVDADYIFRLYFEKKAPFGPGKKKSEFPDAFILAAISLESEDELSPVYVVSNDKDFSTAAESFNGIIHLDSLGKYLELVNCHYENLAPLVMEIMVENKQVVKDAIKKQFLELGFYLGDQQGEVYDVNINEIWGLEGHLVCVSNEHASFELIPTVEYTASILYDDLDTAIYDSEEKIFIPLRKIETEVERSEVLQVDLTITFSSSDRSIFDFDKIEILSPKQDVEVIVIDDGWSCN